MADATGRKIPGETRGEIAADKVLAALSAVLEQRKRDADPARSYVASLHSKGLDKILEKVGEECIETVLAAKNAEAAGDAGTLVSETADLWFHCLVMLSHLNCDYRDVMAELARRFDLSGLEEKASRPRARP